MKTQGKRSLLIVGVLVLSLLFSMSAVWASADSEREEGPPTRTITMIIPTFYEESSTSAKADVTGYSNGISPYITSKITLQSAPLGTSTYTNVSGVRAKIKTVYDTSWINHVCTFPITSNYEYRIKIEITDYLNECEVTSTTHCNLS